MRNCSEKSLFVLVYSKVSGDKFWKRKLGDRLYNTDSGYCFFDEKNNVILEQITAEHFSDLDWSKTSLLVKDSNCGWLDRCGKFYGCSYRNHDLLADYIIGKEVRTLEDTGWVRLGLGGHWSMGARPGLRLSAEQRNWMLARGYELEDYQ